MECGVSASLDSTVSPSRELPRAADTAPAAALSSLPLFADSFCSSADFSAVAALLEEEEDEQRDRERAVRDEAKLRRRRQRMEVDPSTAAPASTARLHRSQRRQAAQPYSRPVAVGQQRSGSSKRSKPTRIQPPVASQLGAGSERAGTLTAAETALFMQMWHINAQDD